MADGNQIVIPPVTYGVWRPGKGWLQATREDGTVMAFADLHRSVAQAVARWLGEGARVEYVDESLFRLQSTLLEADQARKDRRSWVISTLSKLRSKRRSSSR